MIIDVAALDVVDSFTASILADCATMVDFEARNWRSSACSLTWPSPWSSSA